MSSSKDSYSSLSAGNCVESLKRKYLNKFQLFINDLSQKINYAETNNINLLKDTSSKMGVKIEEHFKSLISQCRVNRAKLEEERCQLLQQLRNHENLNSTKLRTAKKRSITSKKPG
jgi:hypothetical protein